jgi:hypothetical protein
MAFGTERNRASRWEEGGRSHRLGAAGGQVARVVTQNAFYSSFYAAAVVKPSGVFFLPTILWTLWHIALIGLVASFGVGPIVSNDLLSVQAHTPVTCFSLRLSTRAGSPVEGDPISPTASVQGPEVERAACTSTKAEA